MELQRALKQGDVAASALAKHTLVTGRPVDLTKLEVVDCHLTPPHTVYIGTYNYTTEP